MYQRSCTAIFLALTLCGKLHAQNTAVARQLTGYIFRNIDNNNGLLNNDVSSIGQDDRGFIWIGTQKGLQRYDGLRFVNYHDINDVPGASNGVSDLYPDSSRNCIWVIKNYRLSRLNLLNNQYTAANEKQPLNHIKDEYTDWDGGKWAVYHDQLPQISKPNGDRAGYLLINEPNGRSDYFIPFLTDQARHHTWMLNNLLGGPILLDDVSRKIYTADHNAIADPLLEEIKKKQQQLPRNTIVGRFRNAFLDSHHNLWLITWGPYFFRFNFDSKLFTSYSIVDIMKRQGVKKIITGSANNIMEDNHTAIWIATTNAGLLKYNPGEDNFDYMLDQPGSSTDIHYNYEISCIYQDREENIWVGTDKGISIFNPYRQYFNVIQHEPYNAQSLPKSEINALIETNRGDLLVGTWGGGIAVYDRELHFKKNINFPDITQKNEVWSFAQNDDGTIWAGCQWGFLHIIDPANLSVHTLRPPELRNSTIRAIVKDAQGNMWLGLHNGTVIKWEKDKKRFRPFNYRSPADSLAIISSPVSYIFLDKFHKFWVSTMNGLKEFDENNNLFTTIYLPHKKDSNAISSAYCYGIEECNDSTLMIGTEDGGLNFFNKRTKLFSQPSISDGKSPYSVYGIKKDQAGNIWFTTNNAIYKFIPQFNQFISYLTGNGTINTTATGNPFYITRNGLWLTWTLTKILSFYPASFNERKNNVAVTISGFKVFDKPILIDSLLKAGKPVKLSYQQNFINIEFTAIRFSGIQQTKYYYRLSGVDNDWVNADVKGFASYTNLQPGEYTFNVKTGDGNSSEPVTSIDIVIRPPFWKTWWFRILVVLAAAFSLYMLVIHRIKSIRKEAGLKHKIAETEMMALRAQMNPHFIFNCINAIDNLIQTDQKDKATTYLARFAKLIRVVLDSSKNNVVPFHKEFEALDLFLQLEQFRCSNKFQYELTADEELLQGDYKVPPLLVQPFIENAIHHGLMNKPGTDKKLFVKITVEGEEIKYAIRDNGVGRGKAQQIKDLNKPEHVSYGIQISTERIHLHNKSSREKDIMITDLFTNGEAAGTVVEVWVKLNNN